MEFHSLNLTDYEHVHSMLSRYGEGSCQHSFVNMYTLFDKYGDMIAEEGGFLYILRSKLCDEKYRVYLAPMGGGDMKAAFEKIFEDAHSHGKRVRFLTLTQSRQAMLEEFFPGRFDIREERDLFEYIYLTDAWKDFGTDALHRKQYEIGHFHRKYGQRVSTGPITEADFEEMLAFEEKWLSQLPETHDIASLKRESERICDHIRNFKALHLSGIVLRIDGEVSGFNYGAEINGEYYGGVAEKGDRSYRDIYKVLNNEYAKHIAAEYKYINAEEDLGIESLRESKLSYDPAYLIKKYVAEEK